MEDEEYIDEYGIVYVKGGIEVDRFITDDPVEIMQEILDFMNDSQIEGITPTAVQIVKQPREKWNMEDEEEDGE